MCIQFFAERGPTNAGSMTARIISLIAMRSFVGNIQNQKISVQITTLSYAVPTLGCTFPIK